MQKSVPRIVHPHSARPCAFFVFFPFRCSCQRYHRYGPALRFHSRVRVSALHRLPREYPSPRSLLSPCKRRTSRLSPLPSYEESREDHQSNLRKTSDLYRKEAAGAIESSPRFPSVLSSSFLAPFLLILSSRLGSAVVGFRIPAYYMHAFMRKMQSDSRI